MDRAGAPGRCGASRSGLASLSLSNADITVAHAASQCSTCRTAFTIWFGSLDVFINVCVIPEIADGKLDALDMVDIVAVLRRWEADGTWDRAHAY